jgi:adenylate cyclase
MKADWPEMAYRHPDASIVHDSATNQLLYRGLRVRMGIHRGEPTCEADPVTG